MKNLLAFFLLVGLFTLASCGDDDSEATGFDYHAHIESPTANTFMQEDTLRISINFEEHNGLIVHHFSVRIYNKADGTEIFSDSGHAHQEESYLYEKDFVLEHDLVPAHTDWVLEAKVWGETDGEDEVIEEFEFHVHPAGISYHIHIHSPNTDDKHVGDQIMLHIEVTEHTGQTVHHVNARIYNKADGTEFFNGPTEAHVHEVDGTYEMMQTLTLNVAPHTDWVLEVKAWGHEDGTAEVVESLEFHVHP